MTKDLRWIACLALLVSSKAAAMQPLAEFLQSARALNSDNQEAEALRDQRAAERAEAWTKLAPVFSATAGDTENQYASVLSLPKGPGGALEGVTITPKLQRSATLAVSVPLIDVGNWQRIGAAKATAEAAEGRRQATGVDVAKAVTRAYYQLIAATALVDAATGSLTVATATLKIAVNRKDSGVASLLDVRRSEADQEEARHNLADADYSVATAKRSLETLSGLTPKAASPGAADNLREEASLDVWESKATPQLPSVAAAIQESDAADQQIAAARAAYLPTLAGNVAENFTNAAGLVGQEKYYTVGLSLNWRLDPGTHYSASAAGAALAGAKAREGRALKAAKDDIYNAWQQVRSQIAKSRSSRAQQVASDEAVKLTQERYGAGTATLLDVIQAQRDAFTAAVNRIQADGDLAVARAVLRLSAGDAVEFVQAVAPEGGAYERK